MIKSPASPPRAGRDQVAPKTLPGASNVRLALPPQLQLNSTAMVKQADSSLVHMLSRTTFGYTEDELANAEQLGFDDYLQSQLDYQAMDTSELDQLLQDLFPSLQWSYQEIFEYIEQQRDDERDGPPVPIQLVLATIVRQWLSPQQLYEVMVEFWTNHFNVYLFDGPVQYLKTVDDRDNIRPHALGKFRDLLHANARSPAMLYYLDNYSNTLEGPNENYARELLELHTLGVNGGYTEFDVKEVARAFTGWTLSDRSEDLFVFAPRLHDDSELSVLGSAIESGLGLAAGEQVLDLLADHPSTANFLAFKLARRFISDDPPQSIVDAVGQTYLDTDGDIKSMLMTLFTSSEFATAQGQKFKRPAEFGISLLRRLEPQSSDRFIGELIDQLGTLGQLPFLAVPPTGYDDTEPDWLSTSALLSRWNFGFSIGFEGAHLRDRSGKPSAPRADFFRRRRRGAGVNLNQLLDGASSPTEIVDQLVERVLHQAVSDDDRQALIEHAAVGAPHDQPLSGRGLENSARRVLAGLLGSHYFQQR